MVNQPIQEIPVGDYRSWSILVPGVDITGGGYTGVWVLGIPEQPEFLELLQDPPAKPATYVRKSSQEGTLQVVPVPEGAVLRFELLQSDTADLDPQFCVGQGWLLNPAGEPVTVTRGIVALTSSLLNA